MSLIVPPRYRLPDVTITPFSDQMRALASCVSIAPASTAVGNTPGFFPIYLVEPFTVAKAFWANAATVGTDYIDLGVYRMTDMATGRCDLIRSTGAVLSAGASAVQEASAWKVARAQITAGGDSTDATSYATASVTLKAGRLYILAVENSKADAQVVSAVTGGPTFTSRATTQYNGTANRVSLWSAVPTVDYTGTLTIDFGGGNTQTGCAWSLVEMSGVDTSTTDGIVQTAVGTGNSTTPLATLGAFGSANNAAIAFHANVGDSTTTPGSGWTELDDTATAATPAQYLETQWRVDNDTTADATITSGQWGSIAAEIKADASAFVIPPSLPGNPNIYMAFAMNGTTARILMQSINPVGQSAAGYLTLASTFPLPSSCIPGTATAWRVPLAGFSLRSLIG